MFGFSKTKSKQSLLDIVSKLQDISHHYKWIALNALIHKVRLDVEHPPQWKDLDGMINKLISQLRYNLNDGNMKTVHALLGYIEKLVDSRIGFSNYYEQLKDPLKKQLQELDISMNEYLDKADKAQLNLEQEPSKYEIYAFEYRSAIIESKQISNIMLDIITRVNDSDLERKKRTAHAQDISDDIKKKADLFAFYDDKTDGVTSRNIDINKSRYKGLEDIEIPAPKVVSSNRASPKTEVDIKTKNTKKIPLEG